MTSLDELERLAGEATPGPWFGFFDGVRLEPSIFGQRNMSSYVCRVLATLGKNEPEHANALYMAAANPQTMLALLAVFKAAKGLMAEPYMSEAEYRSVFTLRHAIAALEAP